MNKIIINTGRTRCEIWSRVVGYLRPLSRWNEGKVSEFKDRLHFSLKNNKGGKN